LALLLFLSCGWEPLAVLQSPLAIETLGHDAELVVHGKVLGKVCQRDSSGRIHTRVEIELIDVWKGRWTGRICPIVHGGGTVGEQRTIVSGQAEYAIGEEVVVFLVTNLQGQHLTIGLSQGKFHIATNETTGAKTARNPFHGSAPAASEKASEPAFPGPLSLSVLRQQAVGGAR
jgi:hypothetical protein